MNAKVAVVVVGLTTLFLPCILALPITTTTTTTTLPAYAAEEIAADITQDSSSKTVEAYSPNPVNVHVGDVVTWTNRDSLPHTVTSGINGRPDGRFDSSPNFNPVIAPAATFNHTFTEAGGYPYYCALHPNMVGTVIVAGAGGGNQTAGGEFTISGTDQEGNKHEIAGISQNATAASFTISPGKSIEIQFDGTGEVELTLPKNVIANITAVQAGTETLQYTAVNENDTSTTVSFRVPEGQTTVQIM